MALLCLLTDSLNYAKIAVIDTSSKRISIIIFCNKEEVVNMANSTERKGVYHCGEIAESNNWMFREQPIHIISHIHHIPWFFHGYFLGLIFKQMKNFSKRQMKSYGAYYIVIMMTNVMNGYVLENRLLNSEKS